jgi:hypothetical protein
MAWGKEKFLNVLAKAHKAERAWVESLRTDHGRAVAHGVKLVLEGHNPKKDFCPTPDAVAAVAIEIKLRNLEFTSPSDFPYDTVFVDDVTGLRKAEAPFAWVYVSQITGCWVWLCSIDRDGSWQERVVYDSMRGFAMPTLVAPSKFLRPAEQLERSEQRARSLTSVIRGLEAEVARLRKSLVDSWGEIPGECSYSKDTKEVHHGQR